MKFIKDNEQGFTTYDQYFSYLESIRAQLAPHVFAFARNEEHHNLSARSSLHDANLLSLELNELQGQDSKELEVRIKLLGQYRDRHIILAYEAVQSYSLSSAFTQRGHGDLLAHELRLEGGLLVHEIQFENATFQVQCKDLQHIQELGQSCA